MLSTIVRFTPPLEQIFVDKSRWINVWRNSNIHRSAWGWGNKSIFQPNMSLYKINSPELQIHKQDKVPCIVTTLWTIMYVHVCFIGLVEAEHCSQKWNVFVHAVVNERLSKPHPNTAAPTNQTWCCVSEYYTNLKYIFSMEQNKCCDKSCICQRSDLMMWAEIWWCKKTFEMVL